MKQHSVKCSKNINHVVQAWTYINDFESTWHPDVSANKIQLDATGAVTRFVTLKDGNAYSERITYLSHTDQLLRYAQIDGIEGVENNRVEVSTADNTICWSASFEALEEIGDTVAADTHVFLNNGLDWLDAHASTSKPISKLSNSKTLKAKADLCNIPINDAPHLSVLSATKPADTCWTLVLFIHGIAGEASYWQPQMEVLTDTYNVAALDLRGYGESTLGNKQTSIEDYCNDILKVMQHFGSRKLLIVGLGMGSWIATSFAMRHPQLLAGLVLTGGCLGLSEAGNDERTQLLNTSAKPLSEGKETAKFADNMVELMFGPNAIEQHKSDLHASICTTSSDTYLDALTCLCIPIERFDFSRIRCSVLLVTGEHDRLATPDDIRQISLDMFSAIDETQRLPDIQFEVLNGAGHLCNLEQPEHFNAMLVKFLQRTSGTMRQATPTRQTKRQMKSQRILEAALVEFSAQGFDGVSMSAIAKRAEVSKPTLYQYYGDKNGLFTSVLQQGCDRIMKPLSAPDGSLVDRLWNFSWVYADFVLSNDMLSIARLAVGEASRRPDIASMYHTAGPGKAFKGLIAFMQECVDANQLDIDDLDFAAHDLWSLILTGPRDYYLHFINEKPDPDQLLRSISHGLRVFLKVYSINREADLEALAIKVDEMQSTLAENLGVTEQ